MKDCLTTCSLWIVQWVVIVLLAMLLSGVPNLFLAQGLGWFLWGLIFGSGPHPYSRMAAMLFVLGILIWSFGFNQTPPGLFDTAIMLLSTFAGLSASPTCYRWGWLRFQGLLGSGEAGEN